MKIDACDVYSVQGFSKDLGEQQPYEPSSRRRDNCSQRERIFSTASQFAKIQWAAFAASSACFVM